MARFIWGSRTKNIFYYFLSECGMHGAFKRLGSLSGQTCLYQSDLNRSPFQIKLTWDVSFLNMIVIFINSIYLGG